MRRRQPTLWGVLFPLSFNILGVKRGGAESLPVTEEQNKLGLNRVKSFPLFLNIFIGHKSQVCPCSTKWWTLRSLKLLHGLIETNSLLLKKKKLKRYLESWSKII